MNGDRLLTITLSGPKVSEQQARNALAAERFEVQGSHDYGLPAATEGQAEAFINVVGEDVDRAVAAVRSLGWSLRLHHENEQDTEVVSLAPRDEVAELKARVAALEGKGA